MDDILTLAEAAKELGLSSPDGLRTQVHRGRLNARLIGKTYVVTRDELERYRAEQLDQFGRPADVVITEHDKMGLAIRITLKVSPWEVAAATAMVRQAIARAMRLDDTFDPGELRLPADTGGLQLDEAFFDRLGGTYRATVRRRSTAVGDGLVAPPPYVSPTLAKGRVDDPKATDRRRA